MAEESKYAYDEVNSRSFHILSIIKVILSFR